MNQYYLTFKTKIKKIIFLIFLFNFLLTSNISGQKNEYNNNLNLANEFYANKKYEKASVLFEKLYKKKKSSKIYSSYLDCLIKLSEFGKAIEVVKSYYKKSGRNPAILIDLGELYILKGEPDLAKTQFNQSIHEIKSKPNFILSVASNFYKKNLYDYALQAYLLAKEKNKNSNYSFQIANIYSQLGEIENMYTELLDLLERFPAYLQTCKNRIIRTINDDSKNENNLLFKKIIIKKLQKQDSEILNDLLIWLYLQEKNFTMALEQQIAIDKRTNLYDLEIFELGEIAMSNVKLEVAQNAFNYIINKGAYSIYYEESILKSISIKYLIFKNKPVKKKHEIENIIKAHQDVITLLGKKNETILIIKDLAHILAFYQKNKVKAKNLLISILEGENYSDENLAYIKLELGDILISENKIWDAILYYSQVEKKFKNDIIGQKAKFKKIQVDYYTGDFNWAQAQLDVLKNSTSKLISNNAIELSLLITDNLNLDTAQTALSLYAQAELLMFQNNYEQAIQLFDNIEFLFPDHTLIDEILFKKAIIQISKKEYSKALNYLNDICQKYAESSILFDDALYKQGYILETIIKDKEKAKKIYEKLLLEQPGSIFLAETRKRYRKLRSEKK